MLAWLYRFYEREVLRRPAWMQGLTPWWAERAGSSPVAERNRRVR